MMRSVFFAAVAVFLAPAAVARAQQTVNPHGELALTCATCHAPDSWKPARVASTFKHAPRTFPLEGAHARTSCTGCHKQLDFKGVSKTCASCHDDVHQGELGVDCSRCHTPRSFAEEPAMKQVHEQTRFPLRGGHTTVACAACHARSSGGQLRFTGTNTTCAGCHASDARSAQPDHQGAAFQRECTSCHTINSWANARFDHGATRFALTGAHNAVPCTTCHTGGVYRATSIECASCHQSDSTAATNPPHGSALFTAPCSSCHNTNAWGGAAFNHDATQFPLTGSHLAPTCAGCHADKIFVGKQTACVSCHQADLAAAKAPPHTGFPTTCQSCHGTSAWAGAAFDHGQTDFPLTGSHRAASCTNCHADGVFNGKSGDCVSCHRTSYDATTRPAHAAAGYSTTCVTCHNTTQWLGAAFNHSATLFPLTGAHVAAPCTSCHADNVYKGKSTECYSCHSTNYSATTRPPHGASAIGTACTSCHSTTAWAGATYDHTVTSFPLTGAHRAVTCNTCHADGVYSAKPTDCLSCHQGDYNATRQPPHATNGLGTSCQGCHTTTTWIGGTFNHSVTTFPLTGAHTATPCLSCHGDGVYRGKSTACLSCHQADYSQTTNPNHAAASFPTTCASCHTTTTWLGATFNHDGQYFPIYSGAHRGKWSSCATCHTSPTNYKVFTCLTCHEHSQSIMDAKHQGRPGYRYDSQACYACHPRGTH